MVRLQATTACNLDCSYCYIPAGVRRRSNVMSEAVLDTLLERLIDEDLLGDRLSVSWHGAEPLVAGLAWFERANASLAARLGSRVRVEQIFQSNGTLIDDAWCEYFVRTGSHVGVSLDGPAGQNTARVNWGGRPSHALALRGTETLNRHGLRWALLAVITYDAMKDPAAFIAFVKSTGCAYLGFKVEETNVDHHSRLEGLDGVETLYAAFVEALWDAFPAGGPIAVREFDAYRDLHGGEVGKRVTPVTLIPFANLTVAANGDFTIFSGELLFRDDDRFVFGNVLDGPLLDCLKGERFRTMTMDMLRGVKRCAAQCEHYDSCGSFYISQKYAETGSFDAAETLACRLEIKTLARAIDAATARGQGATRGAV
jgi:uncharacterized protein